MWLWGKTILENDRWLKVHAPVRHDENFEITWGGVVPTLDESKFWFQYTQKN